MPLAAPRRTPNPSLKRDCQRRATRPAQPLVQSSAPRAWCHTVGSRLAPTLGLTVQHPPSFDDDRPQYDSSLAAELIGKTVLVGVTVNDKRGDLKRYEQFYGVITTAEPATGFTIELQGSRAGETKCLPPATGAFFKAPPGTYNLRSTGECVVDPDYTSTWTLTQPDG